MNQAFTKIFWGYLFIILEIHIIVIDVLAEPIGYYLIFSGIKRLLEDFPIGQKAKGLSFILIFLSLPTVFIQQNIGSEQVVFSGWSVYTTILSLAKLVFVFYLFQLILAFVQRHGHERIITRASKTFKAYMFIMLLGLVASTFMINFATSSFFTIMIVVMVASFVMEIIFLMLLWSLRKIEITPS